MALAWCEGAAVGGSPYLEHLKNILPVMHFLLYSLNIQIISTISPHTLVFIPQSPLVQAEPPSPITPAKGCSRAGLGAAPRTSRSWAARLSLLISSLHRVLNTRSSDRTDAKMACRSGERPTFFEIFKTRCSDSGTA